MKILHFGDAHTRDKDIEECAKVLGYVVGTAHGERPDLIVFSGDFFHSQDVKMDSPAARLVIGTVCSLADIAPVAIVRGTISHDGDAPVILSQVRGKFPIIVADRPMQVTLWRGVFYETPENLDFVNGTYPDAIITLIPQPTKQFYNGHAGISEGNADIQGMMSSLFAGFGAKARAYETAPHILVYHGTVSGATLSNGAVRTGLDIEVSLEQLGMARADVNLCGHIHRPQVLGGNTFYSGSLYPVDIGEDHEHGFYVHKHYEGQSPAWESTFIETPYKRTIRFQYDFTDETIRSEVDFVGVLPWKIEDIPVDGLHVRYDVTIWQDEAGEINKSEIEEAAMEDGALSVDIRITRIPRENVRAASVLEAERLRDKLTRRAELAGEVVAAEVLDMADLLEGTKADDLLRMVAGGAA